MADIDIKVTDNTGRVREELKKRKAAALEAIGITAEGYAKKETPVDTGRLRNSMSHTVVGDDVYIGTNVEYGPYIEMGTVNYTGKHMIKRAASEHGDVYKAIIQRIMQGE